MTRAATSTLERTRDRFGQIASGAHMLEARVSVHVTPLSPEEAIGTPERKDFPILVGRERVVEARVLGSRGHAFTDSPAGFAGTVADVLALTLDANRERAITVATLNASLARLGMATGTVHCRDGEPERCASEIAAHLRERCGSVEVGLAGLNPAIAQRLVETFGPDHVRVTDLDPETIGTRRPGTEVWDARTRTDDLVDASDVILVTGTTLVNDTFDRIWDRIQSAGKTGLVYGVTAAGVCALAGFERICPAGRDG